MDTEFDIYNLIKNEKKKISITSLNNIPKFFIKYYSKFIFIIKKELYKINQNDEMFYNYVDNISNLIFQIFWIIILGSFNQHITIFFLERASILFYEFVNLASKNKNYKIQNVSIVYDAILFTFNKSIGNTTIKQIIDNNHNISKIMFNKINIIREWSNLAIKIINNNIIKKNELPNKQLTILLYNLYTIYKNVNIDKYLVFKFNNIFNDFNINQTNFILKIITDILINFININFFKYHNDDKEIVNFIDYLNNSLDKLIYDNNFFDNFDNFDEIYKKKIYLKFKDSIMRYINY